MRPDEYIPIDSVEDLDPTRISIKDINKRYIDRNGMRYATRFNLKTRKVEVVRIVKGRQEAEMIRRQLVRDKKDQDQQREEARAYSNDGEALTDGEMGGDVGFEGDEAVSANADFATPARGPAPTLVDTANFVERDFMEECASDFDKVRERLQGIINFIKNSRYFENNRSAELTEAFRQIDVEGIQRCENALNYYKELVSYPRPVSYYMSRMGPEVKERLDQVESDEQKMVIVRRIETQALFEETYTKVKEATERLLELLNQVPTDELDLMPHNQHQAFDDARAASTFLLENCMERLNRIAVWRHKYGS